LRQLQSLLPLHLLPHLRYLLCLSRLLLHPP
jgi:hypothetical protein